MAILEDALDLGIPNQRFQNITFRFNRKRFYERETVIAGKIRPFVTDESNRFVLAQILARRNSSVFQAAMSDSAACAGSNSIPLGAGRIRFARNVPTNC